MKYETNFEPHAVELDADCAAALGGSRQWEIAAKILAEIAARATSQPSMKKVGINDVAWLPED